jgi:2'-5' RNA ligase
MSLLVLSYPELSDKAYNWIQSLREKYDKEGFRLTGPHFTLVFPVSGVNQADFIEHIVKTAKEIPSINLTLDRSRLSPDMFEGKYYIFLIPDSGRKEIKELHDCLYTGILAPKLSTEFIFLPHITVGCFEDKNLCLGIIDKINKDGFCINGRMATLDIVAYENKRIKTIKRIDLK